MKRWQIIVAAVTAAFAVAIGVGYHIGAKVLQGQIIEALGPGSRVAAIKVNSFSVELLGLSIDAPRGWPAARSLEAERITIFPNLRSLFSDQIEISSIVIEKPYLSMIRTPGKIRLVPNLTESAHTKTANGRVRAVSIATIELKDGSLDLYDATVQRPPLKIRMERIAALIRDVTTPARERTRFEITGIVKGVKRDGQAQLAGWIGPGGRDTSSRVALVDADMVALQPYLVKKNEASVSRGAVSLSLNSEVRNKILDGKGKIVLKDLDFAPARGFFDTFMGLPRSAVLNFLKDNNNAIDLDFTLAGDLDNPNFSLNEKLSTRVAMGMAGQLGVGIGNVAEGLGTLGRKGMEGAGNLVEGVGSAIKELFTSKQ